MMRSDIKYKSNVTIYILSVVTKVLLLKIKKIKKGEKYNGFKKSC